MKHTNVLVLNAIICSGRYTFGCGARAAFELFSARLRGASTSKRTRAERKNFQRRLPGIYPRLPNENMSNCQNETHAACCTREITQCNPDPAGARHVISPRAGRQEEGPGSKHDCSRS